MVVAGPGPSRARKTRASRVRATAAAVAPAAEEQSADDADRPGQERLAWLDLPRSGKISEAIARGILDHLAVRKLPPGTLLSSEAGLADPYGVGRGPQRGAL